MASEMDFGGLFAGDQILLTLKTTYTDFNFSGEPDSDDGSGKSSLTTDLLIEIFDDYIAGEDPQGAS